MTTSGERSLLAATVGTVVFVAFVPGTVVVVAPRLLSGWRIQPPLFAWAPVRWIGLVLVLLALPVFLVRNPGYIAVVSMVVGQGLFLGSKAVLVYAACLALGFHLFVVLYEEPTLRGQFGEQYAAYCRRVPRWFPRVRGNGSGH